MNNHFHNSYLIQRLCKPMNHEILAETFAFGGGLKNGGLSEDAMKLLRPIFSFDYMGSAEFEFGAIPETFRRIATHIKEYSTWEININKKPVYVIGASKFKGNIDETINKVSKNKIHLKEYAGLDHALDLDKYSKNRECRYIGWLELDNGFMFFIDKTTFEQTAELFGLKQLEKI